MLTILSFVLLALVAAIVVLPLLLVLMLGFAFETNGMPRLGLWSVTALVVAITNTIGAMRAINRATRSALLLHLSLSGIALGGFWLTWPD